MNQVSDKNGEVRTKILSHHRTRSGVI